MKKQEFHLPKQLGYARRFHIISLHGVREIDGMWRARLLENGRRIRRMNGLSRRKSLSGMFGVLGRILLLMPRLGGLLLERLLGS